MLIELCTVDGKVASCVFHCHIIRFRNLIITVSFERAKNYTCRNEVVISLSVDNGSPVIIKLIKISDENYRIAVRCVTWGELQNGIFLKVLCKDGVWLILQNVWKRIYYTCQYMIIIVMRTHEIQFSCSYIYLLWYIETCILTSDIRKGKMQSWILYRKLLRHRHQTLHICLAIYHQSL